MTDGPRRTCVACREIREKPQLVRLIRLPEGIVVVDETATAPGRGAYVCRSPGCAARLLKGGRLSQAFRRPSAPEATLIASVGAMVQERAQRVSGVVTDLVNVTSRR